MATLKKGLSKLNDGALVAKAEHIIDSLTANIATFATPSPTLVVLTAATNAFSDAVVAALDGSHAAFSDKRAKRKSLMDLLVLEADYVANVAAGDGTKIINGGFEVRKTPVPAGVPTTPDFADYRPSNYAGTVEFAWSSKYARSYQVFLTEKDPESPSAAWELIGSTTKRFFSKSGLEPGKVYWVQVVAVGVAGVSPASRPLMCRAA